MVLLGETISFQFPTTFACSIIWVYFLNFFLQLDFLDNFQLSCILLIKFQLYCLFSASYTIIFHFISKSNDIILQNYYDYITQVNQLAAVFHLTSQSIIEGI